MADDTDYGWLLNPEPVASAPEPAISPDYIDYGATGGVLPATQYTPDQTMPYSPLSGSTSRGGGEEWDLQPNYGPYYGSTAPSSSPGNSPNPSSSPGNSPNPSQPSGGYSWGATPSLRSPSGSTSPVITQGAPPQSMMGSPTPVQPQRTPLARPSLGAPAGGGGAIKVAPGGTAATNFNIPAYDWGKVEELTQQNAAPGIRALRSGINRVAGQSYQNPNVKRLTLRDALAGYGQGLENVMAGARSSAVGEYNAQYGPQVQGALQANQIAAQQSSQSSSQAFQGQLAQYTNLWNEYLHSLG